jgi:hypothetical protein
LAFFYLKALQLRVDGRGRSLKHGRYLDDSLARLKQVVQLLWLPGGTWSS